MRFYFRSIVDGTHRAFESGPSAKAWSLTVLTNTVKDWHRTEARGPPWSAAWSGVRFPRFSSGCHPSGHQASHQAEIGVMEGVILGGRSPVSLGGTHQTRRLLGGRLGAPQSGPSFPWWPAWATRHLTPDTLRLTKHPHGRHVTVDRWNVGSSLRGPHLGW